MINILRWDETIFYYFSYVFGSFLVPESIPTFSDYILPCTLKHSDIQWLHLILYMKIFRHAKTTSYIVYENIPTYSDHILPSTWKHSGTRWQHLSYLIPGSIPTYSDHILNCNQKHSDIQWLYLTTLYLKTFRHTTTTSYFVLKSISAHNDNILLNTWKHSGTQWQHLSYLIPVSISTYSKHILLWTWKPTHLWHTVTTYYNITEEIPIYSDHLKTNQPAWFAGNVKETRYISSSQPSHKTFILNKNHILTT